MDKQSPSSHRDLGLVGTSEIAGILGVHSITISKWTTTRRIPSYKIGKRRFYRVDEVLRCLRTEAIPQS